MTKRNFDWSVMRNTSIFFLLAILISAGLVFASYHYMYEKQISYDDANNDFKTQSRKYLTIDEQEQMISEYLPPYNELIQSGIIGDEHRLNWAENIRTISRQIDIPSLRFSIKPRKLHELEVSLNTGQFSIYASRMSLDMGLLHEVDLIRFLDLLRKYAKGLFTTDSCILRMSSRELRKVYGSVNITAKCELSWLTLVPPDEGVF